MAESVASVTLSSESNCSCLPEERGASGSSGSAARIQRSRLEPQAQQARASADTPARAAQTYCRVALRQTTRRAMRRATRAAWARAQRRPVSDYTRGAGA